MSVTKDQFEAALQTAIEGRKKLYTTAYAFHWRWEDDNTSADRDEESFTQLAEILNFPKPEVYIIPKRPRYSKIPGFDLHGKIANVLAKAAHDPGDSVVMLHYSGHGRENMLGELELLNLTGKVIPADRLLQDIQTDRIIPLDETVDVIIILDCCFSFLASRTARQQHRRVDILCANERRDPVALGAGTSCSFTSKLLVEARSRAQNGDVTVELSNLIETLREKSPRKKPTYAARLGLGSIILPLVPTIPSVASRPPAPGLLATFSMHVSDNFTEKELKDLVSWMGMLPKSKSAGLKLESIKKTHSMLFIFETNLRSFHRISGMPGVNLICENYDSRYDHILRPPSSAGFPLRGLNPNACHQENTKK